MINYFFSKVAALVLQGPVNKGFFLVIEGFDNVVINSD
ncbi:hypothetical protein PMI25_002679 [Pseudomonas sp. GM30]|nr:hypothetical protein PMI25_002679 [Pseudomonas sp. GM30]